MNDMDNLNSSSSSVATLEHQLAQLSEWPVQSDAQVWQDALRDTRDQRPSARSLEIRFLFWPLPRSAAAVLIIALIGLALTLMFAPSFGGHRQAVSLATPSSQNLKQMDTATATYGAQWKDRQLTYAYGTTFTDSDRSGGAGAAAVFRANGDILRGGNTDGFNGGFPQAGAEGERAAQESTENLYSAMIMQNYYKSEGNAAVEQSAGGAGARSPGSEGAWGDRAVVRKAQMDLLTDNVRTAFLKAQHLVSEANGEYVQDSALVGTEKDKNLQANLTLRVTAERLSAVLNELRELGKVNAESSGGEDVTATMIDLEARLSNERRVEKELLDLMEKRSEAPLKEVLELRDKIGQIRQNIETMAAQRERLGRLVSLATILVIIRTEPEQPKPATQPAQKTIGQYFGESLSTAWNNSLLSLADSVAGMLKFAVGGIFWWVALIAGIIAMRNHLRKRMMVAATRA